jgi:hypothetical protein
VASLESSTPVYLDKAPIGSDIDLPALNVATRLYLVVILNVPADLSSVL